MTRESGAKSVVVRKGRRLNHPDPPRNSEPIGYSVQAVAAYTSEEVNGGGAAMNAPSIAFAQGVSTLIEFVLSTEMDAQRTKLAMKSQFLQPQWTLQTQLSSHHEEHSDINSLLLKVSQDDVE
jgi:hypothetical protein